MPPERAGEQLEENETADLIAGCTMYHDYLGSVNTRVYILADLIKKIQFLLN